MANITNYQWVNTFLNYCITPRDKVYDFLKSRSMLPTRYNYIQLDKHTLTDTDYSDYTFGLDDFDQLNQEYLNKFRVKSNFQRFDQFSRPTGTRLHYFYNQNTILNIWQLPAVSPDRIGKIVIQVIHNPYDRTKKHKFYFLDIDEIKIIKQSALSYLIAIIKIKGVWYFAKFSDFSQDELFINFQVPLTDQLWLNNSRLMDINESYNELNTFDVISYDSAGTFWYGRLIIKGSKEFNWEHNGYVTLGKDNNTGNYQLSNVRGLTVSSLKKNDSFYGNILISAIGSSRGNQSQSRIADYSHKNTFQDSYTVDSSTWRKQVLNPDTIPGQEINTSIYNEFNAIFSNNSANTFNWRKANLNLEFARFGANTVSTTILLPTNVLNALASANTEQKLLFKLGEFGNDDRHDKWRIYIGNTFIREIPLGLPSVSNAIPRNYTISFHLDLQLSYNINTQADTSSKVFKLLVREFPSNAKKIIFEIDKELDNVEDSLPGIALTNNEIYVPVKRYGLWALYLFDNNYNLSATVSSTNTNENTRTLTKTQAVRVTTINNVKVNAFDDPRDIRLIKVTAGANSINTLLIQSPNVLTLFYRNGDTNEFISTPFYIPHESTKFIIANREQNTIKVLLNFNPTAPRLPGAWAGGSNTSNPYVYKWVNIKHDAYKLSANNSPYLFNPIPEHNTLKENLTIATLQEENLLFSVNANVSTVKDDTIILNATIDPNTLIKQGEIENKTYNLQWMDNNNNVAFNLSNAKLSKELGQGIELSSQIKLNWVLNGVRDQARSNDLANIFKDWNSLSKFRLTHYRYKVRVPGKTKIWQDIKEIKNAYVDGNELKILIAETWENDTPETETWYDWEIGSTESDTWTKLSYAHVVLDYDCVINSLITIQMKEQNG